MTSGQYVQAKQRAWAVRKGISLQGSAGGRGAPNYTLSVGENLLGGELHPTVAASFHAGAGGELKGPIPTMSALHSSAALAVNLFQYWVVRDDLATLATILEVPSRGITKGSFEEQFPVCDAPEARGFVRSPHLDFAMQYADGGCVGIECKLFEPYGRLAHTPLRKPYLDLPDAWHDIPEWRRLAEQLAVDSAGYHRLGAAQLVKHVLGLKFGRPADKVRLLYLYCDAIGDDATQHRDEIQRFEAAVSGGAVRFVPLSVQEFVLRAVRRVRAEHPAYVDYLAERYL